MQGGGVEAPRGREGEGGSRPNRYNMRPREAHTFMVLGHHHHHRQCGYHWLTECSHHQPPLLLLLLFPARRILRGFTSVRCINYSGSQLIGVLLCGSCLSLQCMEMMMLWLDCTTFDNNKQGVYREGGGEVRTAL